MAHLRGDTGTLAGVEIWGMRNTGRHERGEREGEDTYIQVHICAICTTPKTQQYIYKTRLNAKITKRKKSTHTCMQKTVQCVSEESGEPRGVLR